MKKWLNELTSDMRFLWRKTRRSARVVAKSWANGKPLEHFNGIASRNGRPSTFADPLTSETLLTGEPAHYVGQNSMGIEAREEVMGIGQYHQG